ncbi:MAG: diguanylate cyclase [Sulfurovum sp.]|nr:diguanylate cyclase [Sulfurovum sp.]
MADNNQIVDIVTKIKSVFPATCINGKEEDEINMSIGCAYFPDDGYNFNQLIVIADRNMYQDKNLND